MNRFLRGISFHCDKNPGPSHPLNGNASLQPRTVFSRVWPLPLAFTHPVSCRTQPAPGLAHFSTHPVLTLAQSCVNRAKNLDSFWALEQSSRVVFKFRAPSPSARWQKVFPKWLKPSCDWHGLPNFRVCLHERLENAAFIQRQAHSDGEFNLFVQRKRHARRLERAPPQESEAPSCGRLVCWETFRCAKLSPASRIKYSHKLP